MKLSTRSRYGVRILLELALHLGEGPLQVSVISKRQGIPVKYLEQLIRTLKKAQLVSSVRGPKGGHEMSCHPKEVSLGDLVRLFEGQEDLVACISSPDNCPKSADCKVRIAWQEATNAMFEKLDAISIADLMNGTGPISKGRVC